MKQLGITEKEEIERDGRRDLQREGARVGARLHARVGGLRHPPGALGRLRARLQDARHRLHGDASCGRSRPCYDKGLAYEGYRVLPYCWRDETPLSTHELRMDDDVYKMRQDPSVTVTFPLVGAQGRGARAHRRACPRVDDDAVDAADEPRARRRPRHPLRRRPGRSAGRRRRASRARRPQPTSTPRRNRTATCSPRTCCRTTRRTSATRPGGCRARPSCRPSIWAPTSQDVTYDRLFDYYADAETWGTAERLAHPRRRLRHDRRRHRHRPPGPGLR